MHTPTSSSMNLEMPLRGRDRLSSLPREVATATFKLLSHSEFKNLRLTSHRCSSISEPLLFQQIVIAPYMASLGKLSSISKHCRLRKYVKEIIYDARKFHLPKHSGEGSALIASQEFLDTYVGASSAAAEVMLLTKSFMDLPALTSVGVSDGVKPWWECYRPMSGCISRALKGTLLSKKRFLALCDTELSQKCAVVILAAYAAGCLQRYDGPFPFPATDENVEPSVCTKNALHVAFTKLKSISLRYSVDKANSSQAHHNWIEDQDSLANVLKSNQVLEHIAITNFRHTHGYYEPQFTFARLFGDCAFFPNLKSLTLCSFMVSQAVLESFLSCHSKTLSSLSLADIELMSGGRDLDGSDRVSSWPSLLRFLRKEMSLQIVSFDGMFETTDKFEAWELSVSRKLRHFHGDSKRRPSSSQPEMLPWARDVEIDEHGNAFYDEDNCLKRQIEDWVVHGKGDCPLERARSRDASSDAQTLQLPSSWKGDYSWRCQWLDGHPTFSRIEWIKSNPNKRKRSRSG